MMVSVADLKAEFPSIFMKDNTGELLYRLWVSKEIDLIFFEGLFPQKVCGTSAKLNEYVKGIDNINRDRDRRIALLLLCFDTKDSFKALDCLEIDEESASKIKKVLVFRDDFNLLDNIYKIKQFISKHGEDTFEFMQKVTYAQVKLHELNQIRFDIRRACYEELKKSGKPVHMSELCICEDELLTQGICSKEKLESTMNALLNLVHKEPKANDKDFLIKKAKNMNAPIGNKLLKKFLGRY